MKKSKVTKSIAIVLLCAGASINASLTANKKNEKYNRDGELYQNSDLMREGLFGAPLTISNPGKPIVIVVDSSIPEEYHLEIERAVETLGKLFPGLTFKFKVVDSSIIGDIRFSQMNNRMHGVYSSLLPPEADPAAVNMTFENYLNSTLNRGGLILLNPNYYDHIYQLIIHETSHSLGMRDVAFYSIFNGNLSLMAKEPTEDDYEIGSFYYPTEVQSRGR